MPRFFFHMRDEDRLVEAVGLAQRIRLRLGDGRAHGGTLGDVGIDEITRR